MLTNLNKKQNHNLLNKGIVAIFALTYAKELLKSVKVSFEKG